MTTETAPHAATARATANEPLVRVEDLRVTFTSRDATVNAVNGVNFTLDQGEVLCILGESGSGKSVTLRALMRLLPPRRSRLGGKVMIGGRDVMAMNDDQLADLRGADVAMIFQEPMTAFDPVYTIGQQITETITRHDGVSQSAARARALELLELVQIPSPERRLKSYPHEMSGGMRQRAMIALALSCRPSLLLADEPTTALDATVQIQILLLLRKLRRELGMAVLFVTHDVGVAVEIADRIAVMYAGRFVETGPVATLIREPEHPYTRGLLSSTVHGAMRGRRLEAIGGSPPNLTALPPGCSFAPRCRYAEPACDAAVPAEVWINPQHMARCIRVAPGQAASGGFTLRKP
ncbi:MAG: ABC transporter ATP-binding protein [Alphaproteobacteria bacterium]|nr:ABC transporter ATP-binding protein [Alphaproteobacteria bacterium]